MYAKDRQTGINIIGNIHWGANISLIYETQKDLADILVPYFIALLTFFSVNGSDVTHTHQQRE